jgi:predicted RNA-binding Zn ribbon-like protein
MQPGGRAPAPGDLALVQAFANTKDLLTQQDVLTDPEMLRAWLMTRQLLRRDATIDEEEFQRALAFREALRSLVCVNTGAPLDAGVREVLDAAAWRAHLTLRFSPEGHASLEPSATGLDLALGRLLAIVFTSMSEGSWARLKACRNEACQWIYYDTSKNRVGAWCTMTMCGNRVKTATYRLKRRARQR